MGRYDMAYGCAVLLCLRRGWSFAEADRAARAAVEVMQARAAVREGAG